MTYKKKHKYLRIISWIVSICMFLDIIIFVSAMMIFPVKHEHKKHPITHIIPDIPVNSFSEESEITEVRREETEIVPTTTPTITPTITPIPEKETETISEESKYSKEDIALLERVTMSESSNQPFKAKVAVAQTIINRLHSGKYGKTIRHIVYSPDQYSTADNGDPNYEVIAAVKEAINNEPYPDNMFYFRQYHYHKWASDYKKIGALYFSLKA